VAGGALELPLRGGSAQAAVVGFGIRNLPDRPAALAEIHRLLGPGGRLAVLEFGLPAGRAARGPYLLDRKHLMPRVAALLSPAPGAYRYLADSIVAFPSPAEFAAAMAAAGFASVEVKRLTGGVAVRYLAVKMHGSRRGGRT
jgi:demethylmenaquinone methyltransferase/2-methoxy-6-polyprenyl-1,4-benzoquinol methylase